MDDANELRSLAEHARIKADTMGDAQCKRMMLHIADMYDELARWADERHASHKSSSLSKTG
jgi:hypothetical protein